MVVRTLYELQQADLALEALHRTLATLEARLRDTSPLDNARRLLEETRQQETALRLRQRELELTLADLEQKVKDLERRMFSGRVTNPKELLSLQEEVKLLKGRISQTEDALLQVMEQVEHASQVVKTAQEEYRRVETLWHSQRQVWEQDYQRALQEKQTLEQRRAMLANALDGPSLALYASLRESKNGLAVAKVERGVCRGCGMAVPQGLIPRVRGGKEVVRCPSCGRLLYGE
ncbi:hypothetical protein HRbin23_00182 [bacterium HR23]|nr:hypothetical protein HRbin23_00182 [bacterium HR23]